MGPSTSSYLSNAAPFQFHDYVKKSNSPKLGLLQLGVHPDY